MISKSRFLSTYLYFINDLSRLIDSSPLTYIIIYKMLIYSIENLWIDSRSESKHRNRQKRKSQLILCINFFSFKSQKYINNIYYYNAYYTTLNPKISSSTFSFEFQNTRFSRWMLIVKKSWLIKWKLTEKKGKTFITSVLY